MRTSRFESVWLMICDRVLGRRRTPRDPPKRITELMELSSRVSTLAYDSPEGGWVSMTLTVCCGGRNSRAPSSQRRKTKSVEPRRRKRLAPAPGRLRSLGEGDVTSALAADPEVVGAQVVPSRARWLLEVHIDAVAALGRWVRLFERQKTLVAHRLDLLAYRRVLRNVLPDDAHLRAGKGVSNIERHRRGRAGRDHAGLLDHDPVRVGGIAEPVAVHMHIRAAAARDVVGRLAHGGPAAASGRRLALLAPTGRDLVFLAATACGEGRGQHESKENLRRLRHLQLAPLAEG